MPIDLSVVGKELPQLDHEFTTRDVMLYNLGIGAGSVSYTHLTLPTIYSV